MDVKKSFTAFAVVLLILLMVIFVGVIISHTVMDTYDPCEDMERMQSGDYDILFDVSGNNFLNTSSISSA